MSNSQAVAAEARAALARAQVTQTNLAEATGRSQGYWSKRLSGKQPLDVEDLSAISRLTGVAVARLIGEAVA